MLNRNNPQHSPEPLSIRHMPFCLSQLVLSPEPGPDDYLATAVRLPHLRSGTRDGGRVPGTPPCKPT